MQTNDFFFVKKDAKIVIGRAKTSSTTARSRNVLLVASLSKSRISIFTKLTWNLPWKVASPLADQISRIVAELERNECKELSLFSKLTWNLLWYRY